MRNPSLERGLKQILWIIAVAGSDIVFGMNTDSMVDNTGHIAGFAAGFTLSIIMAPTYRLVPAPQHNAPQAPEQAAEPAEVVVEPLSVDEALAAVPEKVLSVLDRLELFGSRNEVLAEQDAPTSAPTTLAPPPERLLAVDTTSNVTRVAAAVWFSLSLALATYLHVSSAVPAPPPL